MAYTIRIKRASGTELTLPEWQRAAEKHPLVRLANEPEIVVANPKSGQKICRKTSEGDAEIWSEDERTWVYALRWGEDGCVRVNAPRDFDDPNSFLRKLLRELADDLSAGVYGEADEEYHR
ncbi:hypothetical protein [Celeribacter baekdonensis]|jgi:hypothetical protein|uniref:hypothetical protein n=1 Tax=Celeribacter baekdonensis TaxID=875171 RepID=UPI0030DDD048|tara:strand:- start:359901 stop:360263 length:363 start_codon:yes stop_codon:yes gene_type:complete